MRTLLITLTLFLFCSCGSEKIEPVGDLRVAVSHTPLSLPIFVAKSRGFFKAQGLNVQFESHKGGHRCLQSVLDGQVDAGTCSEMPLVNAAINQEDFQIIMTFVTSNNDVKIISHKDSLINNPAHFANKRAAVIKGASSEFLLDTFLLFNFIQPSQLEIIHAHPEEMLKLLSEKRVDIVVPWEPFAFQICEALNGSVRLHAYDRTIYTETFNLVVPNKKIKEKDRELEAFTRAIYQAIEFIKTNPVQAQQILAEELNLDQRFVMWIWQDMHYELSLRQNLLNLLETQAEWLISKDKEKAQKIPNFLDFTDPRFINRIKKLNHTTLYQ